MCGLVTVGKITVPDSPVSAVHISEEIKSGTYTDGEYTGIGTGFRGDTEVQVTVKNGVISEITVLSYEDDDAFFNRARSSVLSSILSSQSVDVDTISGATFSSEGIIEAVANALELANNTVSGNEAASESNDGQSGADDEPETTQEPVESSTESNVGSSGSLNLSSLVDGVYRGSGTGFRGMTKVSVTVKNGTIIDIAVDSYEDDKRFFRKANSSIIDSILTAQSIEVDTVSGATLSSNGIIEAIANALGVSFENPNLTNDDGR